MTELEKNLKDANTLWEINRDYLIQNGNNLKSKSIAVVKRIFCKVGRILLQPILSKQVAYNAATVRVINEQQLQIIKLNNQIEKLNEQVQEQAIRQTMRDGAGIAIDYKEFENRMRGSREEIKERLKEYEGIINQVKVNSGKKLFALDLGCGRGEWLELLQDYQIVALGVDTDNTMLNECKKRGLDVINEDLLVYLQNMHSASADIVTAFQVVEHLPIEVLIETLKEIERILRSGGVVILETPNPENIIIGSCNFYLDPSHTTKLPPELLRFLVRNAGLSTVDIVRLHPYNAINMDDIAIQNNTIQQIANFFNNYADYAVVAYKK